MRTGAFLAGLLLASPIAFGLNPKADDSQVAVVSQGGVTATLGDVDAYVQRVPEEKRAGFIDSPKRIEAMLRNILQVKQLAKQAREMKLDPNDDGTSTLTYAQEDALARLRLAKLDSEIQAPDLSVLAKETYQLHKADYDVQEKVEIAFVVIDDKKHSEAEASELATKVHDLAKANPDDFDKLIAEYSEESTKQRTHGHLENVLARGVNVDFVTAANKLSKPGEISPVVKTRFGLVVIKLVEHVPFRHREFAEIKDAIADGLQKQYVQAQRQDFLDQLSNQPMEPQPEVLANLRGRYGAPMEPPPATAPVTEAKAPAAAAAHSQR